MPKQRELKQLARWLRDHMSMGYARARRAIIENKDEARRLRGLHGWQIKVAHLHIVDPEGAKWHLEKERMLDEKERQRDDG